MIYYRQNVYSLAGIFDDYSVVILLGENYKILQRDAKNISDEMAGPAAENEMRIKKYFNQEINIQVFGYFEWIEIERPNGRVKKSYSIIKSKTIDRAENDSHLAWYINKTKECIMNTRNTLNEYTKCIMNALNAL